MPSEKADLLFHPVRLQVVTALGNHRMTAGQLAEAIPGIPLTTLYRHINALVGGGLVRVVSEVQVRGTIERTYAMAVQPSLKPEDLRGMKKQDYRRVFLIYLSSLLSTAQQYLNSKGEVESFDPLADGFDLNLATLHLTDAEFKEMNQRVLEAMLAAAGNPPAAGRKARTFSYLFIPHE